MREYGLWIDGRNVPGSDTEVSTRRSPSTGEVVAKFALASREDVALAARSAKATFHSGVWSELPGSERGKTLQRFADAIESEIAALARIEADEAGKTITAATGEIQWSLELLRYAATLAWSMPGRLVNHEGAEKFGLVTYQALPVIGMILPWNFPTVTLFQKLPYALVAGCSVVIKPAEMTAGTAMEYARIAKEAGIPDGVISVVPGHGSVVGEALCESPDVNMISFTGSTRVGRLIAAKAGENLKKVALELGGKGANVVFADADMESALNGALAAFTINQGEECCAGGRLIVEASIADAFVARLADKARAMKLGGPDLAGAEIGPMISEGHLEKVLSYVAGAQQEGAVLVTGGKRDEAGDLARGLFVQPTIFTGVSPEMTLFKEEVFGPVLAVTTFETPEEAVRLANRTPYGLANGVWTSSLDTALVMSKQLQSGFVYVNTYLETVPQLPFGGSKESGLGRENGPEGLLEFMETKSTFIRLKTF
jgi:betaine-aldehyde dehydrogenase